MEYFSDAIEFNIMFLLSYSENKSLNRKKVKKRGKCLFTQKGEENSMVWLFWREQKPSIQGEGGGEEVGKANHN